MNVYGMREGSCVCAREGERESKELKGGADEQECAGKCRRDGGQGGGDGGEEKDGRKGGSATGARTHNTHTDAGEAHARNSTRCACARTPHSTGPAEHVPTQQRAGPGTDNGTPGPCHFGHRSGLFIAHGTIGVLARQHSRSTFPDPRPTAAATGGARHSQPPHTGRGLHESLESSLTRQVGAPTPAVTAARA